MQNLTNARKRLRFLGKKDINMLWTLIISLILHRQLGGAKIPSDLPKNLEHTPGFYQLDAHRATQYQIAMTNKLNAAIDKYDVAKQKMYKFSEKIPSPAKTTTFFRLCTATNNVNKIQKKLQTAAEDTKSASDLSRDTNSAINAIHDLAYLSNKKISNIFKVRSK